MPSTAEQKPIAEIREEMLDLFATTSGHEMDDAAITMFDRIWHDLTIGGYIEAIRKDPENPRDLWAEPVFRRWTNRCIARWSRVAAVIGGNAPSARHVELAAIAVVYSTSEQYCNRDLPREPRPRRGDSAKSGASIFLMLQACTRFMAEYRIGDGQPST